MHNYTKIPQILHLTLFLPYTCVCYIAFLISLMYGYIFFSVIPKDCNTNKACVWDKVYQECTITPVLPER